jgi:hypothetical protein
VLPTDVKSCGLELPELPFRVVTITSAGPPVPTRVVTVNEAVMLTERLAVEAPGGDSDVGTDELWVNGSTTPAAESTQTRDSPEISGVGDKPLALLFLSSQYGRTTSIGKTVRNLHRADPKMWGGRK